MDRISLRGLSTLAVSAALLASAAPSLAGDRAPVVGFSTRNAKSAPLAAYRPAGPLPIRPTREVPNEMQTRKATSLSRALTDPVTQKRFGLSQPDPVADFDGASDDDNAAVLGARVVPPDTEGDVGPNHYVQFINGVATIYDKSGGIVLGPVPGNAFWAGLGGPCETQNDGDPLVRYDRQADRWVLSQFALPNYPAGPFYQCFAVSTTNDPTGTYWQYEFKTSDDYFTDYGKLGVWPDAYYMSFNMFGPTDAKGGAYAFDRAAMLAGAPAGMIAFDTGDQLGVLPTDLDGPTPPPSGEPNHFLTFDVEPARLHQWDFHVDWTTPGNSTFTGPTDIPVADFIYPVCDAPRGQCVPQLDSPEKLETLGDRMMWRLVYRNFGDHESLLLNHTVGTESGSAAIRWYELRNPAAPVVYQQGTFAPDANFRWMGSIAMDRNGNIALGYSISSAAMHPSIAITGRLAGDPSGTMGAEDLWLAGAGSQVTSASRWGDYSTMSIDPTDDCTFWYTQEYYAETGSADFKTRIGAFRFPSCTGGASGGLQGTVTGGASALAGATVTATPSGSRPAANGASTTTTDASGHYQFLTLPAGAYDVTASKFGYVTASANGVVVADGGIATEDFALQALPTVVVNGTVTDGSGQGWPLYARLAVSGPAGFPGAVLFTDPVTGYYSIVLPTGGAYAFAVTAIAPGYVAGGGPLSLAASSAAAAASGLVANWKLFAAPTCNAPGYGPGGFAGPPALSESFDGGILPSGWTVDTTSGTSWTIQSGAGPCGEFDGNRTGGSGAYALIDSFCFSDGFTPDDSSLVTPAFDLTGRTSAAIRFASDLVDMGYGAVGSVDVSTDGTTWSNIWRISNPDLPGPSSPLADLSFAAGQPNVKARFHYQGVWAWWWQVDDVLVGTYACTAIPGGLVVGTVSDANTGAGLVGATVSNAAGGPSATTFATPEDPSQGDGFFVLFSESGAQSIQAAYPAHETRTKNATVVPNAAGRIDFSLAAGLLDANPRPLSVSAAPGSSATRTLTLSNSGTGPASFVLQELAVAPPTPPAARPATSADLSKRREAVKRVPFRRLDSADRRGVPLPPHAPAAVPAIAVAGEVVASFPTGLSAGYGLAYDTGSDRLWISDPADPLDGHDGDGSLHAFLPDGTPTNDAIDITATGGSWQAQAAYDGRSNKLWEVNVGGDLCLFEMDPVAKTVTSGRLCGPWTSSQRAVAYDYATDTFYVGGPNDATVYHVDPSGNLLDSAYVGLGISGLAWNPTTRHLFIATESASPFDVWIADAANGYAILGGFRVMNGGSPALPSGGVGLAVDCADRLWMIDPSGQTVYAFASGETGWCVNDMPWLSENPRAGSVGSGVSLPVSVGFDAAGLLPGLRQGSLLVAADTPTPVTPVPVSLTVLFSDVPEGSFASNFIYGAAGAGVMPGCAPQTPTFTFCPADVVTRRSMAGFIERAVHGALTPPPVYLGEFEDVRPGSVNANYIQGLVDDRITAGCSVTPALYCPDVPVTRAQMAVFVWKALHGDAPPPACTAVFADVPCSSPYADYIEGISDAQITAGCGGGNFCPGASITNAQMAVFLVKAFALPYLP